MRHPKAPRPPQGSYRLTGCLQRFGVLDPCDRSQQNCGSGSVASRFQATSGRLGEALENLLRLHEYETLSKLWDVKLRLGGCTDSPAASSNEEIPL